LFILWVRYIHGNQAKPAMAATKLRDHLTLAAHLLQGGALSTLLHWAVMATLVQVDVNPFYATVCGAFAGAACNYLCSSI
jgi:putative flippase GtrA